MGLRIWGCVCCFLLLASVAHAESSFDRELVVKNKARAAQVEEVLKQLLGAYENEDARDFLDYVSEDRFRQDYLTFTDALYQDFRTYEIHRVDYWVDRVVADHIKQFLYVKWEKRYESLDDAEQLNETGYSRFVFDEVNGKYLLIELAGNDLFGASLLEWTEETPTIAGQEVAVSNTPSGQDTPNTPATKADLSISGAIWDGNNSALTFTVNNTGGVASPLCHFLLTTGNSELPIAIPAIPAGGNYIYSGFSAQPTLIEIDVNNVVDESNENNNTTASIVIVPVI